MSRSEPYYEFWWQQLKADPKLAAEYLNEALKETDEPSLFFTACYNVAKAYGLNKLADEIDVHRVSLHKMFSKRGNPAWKNVSALLSAMDLRFRIERIPHGRRA